MDDARISEQTVEDTTHGTTRDTTGDTTEKITEDTARAAPGPLSAQDRIEIYEILSFSSHLLDNRQWDMFGEVFVPDVRLSAPQGEFGGPAGVRRFAETADLARFPATHTLNSIVEAVDADTAVAWSRMLLLTWDRRVACGDYIDTFRRTAAGWRIERRTVAPRNDSASVALAEGGYAPDPYAYAMFDDAVLTAADRTRR
ncbi:nuclear transport factor 2 family protein [Kocuria aegyptia]|uniref:SnoaL-like domain-containing protein n=1 Tax=Kocuria aegyptia TaxID=330943 RepID=A0ABN2L2T6_9MICC